MDNISQYANLGAVAIVFIFCIREFFKWLGKRKNSNGKDSKQDIDLAVIKEKITNFEINCFPTINRKLDKLEEKLDYLLKK